MKVTMEFNLPSEGSELKQALKGVLYRKVLDDLLVDVQNMLKHGAAGQTTIESLGTAGGALAWVGIQVNRRMAEETASNEQTS